MTSAARADLLIEIGTEELPPTSLKALAIAFADAIRAKLAAGALEPGDARWYATPRRIATVVPAVLREQAARRETLRGPPVRVAFGDDGAPTRAALAFAEKCGAGIDDLERLVTDKGEWLSYVAEVPGRSIAELVPAMIVEAAADLPIDRRMRWGSGDAEFVRPVHWVVALIGGDVIDAELFGTRAGRTTYGHRFLSPAGIDLATTDEYPARLESDGYVVADFAERRERVLGEATALAGKLGGQIADDPELFDEVTALNEWPVAIAGRFDADYLQLPPEVLISTLKKHQRYFPIENDAGELLPHFITIANIVSPNPELIAAGNERVVRPRLADAEFFWRSDKRVALADRLDRLANVVYEKSLGSLRDKSERVAALAGDIAAACHVDSDDASRAALLARCDLVTDMVGEFPDLQGTMGSYYARASGESDEVADAIGEFYRPAFSGDRIAATPLGRAIVIADRADTLAGVFAIDKRPKGNRDPFGLRRAALGLARTLIEGDAELDLVVLLESALAAQPVKPAAGDVAGALYDFIVERLRVYFADKLNLATPELFDAVLSTRPRSLPDLEARLIAVRDFGTRAEAETLAGANKRIANLLRRAGTPAAAAVDTALLQAGAERDLAGAVDAAGSEIAPLIEKRAYTDALSRLAALSGPVDAYFDEVLIMAEDPAVRANRLALLSGLRGLFLGIADISVLSRA